MALFSQLIRFFFGFRTYKRGLAIHLLFLLFYSLCFIGVYYFLGCKIHEESTRAYYQRVLSKYLVACMVLHLLLLIAARRKQFALLAKEYFTEKGSAMNLAVFRIMFFFMLAGHFSYVPTTAEISWTYLPHSSRVDLPYMGWLVQNIPIGPLIFQVCAYTSGLLCLLICVGLFTRYALWALIPLAFYVLGVPMFFGKVSHYHILFWLPVFLCFSPVADVWSLDALMRKKRNIVISTSPHIKYILPFKILWLQLAIIYVFAGIIKLWDGGLDWALSESMVNQMEWEWVENYDKVPGFRLDLYPVLAKIGGLCIIYFELLYFLFIIKPSGRIWAFLGAFSLHKLAGYFMYIDFINLRLVQLSYVNWNNMYNRVVLKIKEHRPDDELASTQSTWTTLKAEKVMPTFIVGMIFISLNFVFSALKINSFPFSSYPTYSGIVPNKVQLLRMDAFDSNGVKVDVKAVGSRSGFRWENIRPFEQRIAEIYERKDSVLLKTKLNEYWLLWVYSVPQLKAVTKVDMYLETTSIVPERRKEILKSEYLGTVPDSAKSCIPDGVR